MAWNFPFFSRHLATPPTKTDGQDGPLLSDAQGNLLVSGVGRADDTGLPAGFTGFWGALKNLRDHMVNMVTVGTTQSITFLANQTQKAFAVRVVRPIEGWEVTRSDTYLTIQDGGQTLLKWQPIIFTENLLDDSGTTVASITGAGDWMGQVVKLSTDNIAGLLLQLSGTITPVPIENFNSYTDTTVLRIKWVPSDSVNTPNVLNAGAMKITAQGANKSNSDVVTFTYDTVQNWSTAVAINLDLKQDQLSGVLQLRLRIFDGTAEGNGMQADVSVNTTNVFERRSLAVSSFAPVGSKLPDMAQIKKIEFMVVDCTTTTNAWVDNIDYTTDLGSFDVSLYDLGATDKLPVTLTGLTPLTLDDGLSKVTMTNVLNGSVQAIDVPLTRGLLGNSLKGLGLVKDNYYAIVINGKTNVNVTINWHGSTAGDPYKSGQVFKSTDSGLTLTHTLDGDASFLVRAVPDVALITYIEGDADGDTKLSFARLAIIDIFKKFTIQILAYNFRLIKKTNTQSDLSAMPAQITKAQYLRINYIDQGGTLATLVNISMRFIYPPPTRNQ